MKYYFWGERRYRNSKSKRFKKGRKMASSIAHCRPAAVEAQWSQPFYERFREQIKKGKA